MTREELERFCDDMQSAYELGYRNGVAEVQNWQPIETAPKDKLILLWGRYWSDGQGWFNQPLMGHWVEVRDRWEAVSAVGWFGVRPTHWMLLPEPPQEESE